MRINALVMIDQFSKPVSSKDAQIFNLRIVPILNQSIISFLKTRAHPSFLELLLRRHWMSTCHKYMSLTDKWMVSSNTAIARSPSTAEMGLFELIHKIFQFRLLRFQSTQFARGLVSNHRESQYSRHPPNRPKL